MTRLLVLGSSHVAAMKQAAPEFAARHPDIALSFFAAPGPIFRLGRVNKSGIYAPRFRGKADRKLVATVNGALRIDLKPFDKILVSGFRFSLGDAARLLGDFDILEGADTGKPRLCSMAFMRAAIDHSVQRELRQVTACLGPDRDFVLTDAPYPADSIAQRDDFPLGRALDAFRTHPDGPGLFDHWKASVASAVAVAGYGWHAQPAGTVSGPYATQGRFAGAAPHMDGSELAKTDHRHMNADFGLLMLEDFVATHLNPTPRAA